MGDVTRGIVLPELNAVEAPALPFPIRSRNTSDLQRLDDILPDACLALGGAFVGLRSAGRQIDPRRMGFDGERGADPLDSFFHERLIDQQSCLGRFVVAQVSGRYVRNALIDEAGRGVGSRAGWPRIPIVVVESVSEAGLLTLTGGVIEGKVPLVD